jgi:hypothetical protein
MAPHDNAGLVGKASPRTSNVADNSEPQEIALRLAAEKHAGARLVISLASTATSGGITARPNEPRRHVTNPRERVVTALGARLPISEAIMKNRTMARKLERARVQAREAAAIEFTKPYYLTQPSKRELRAMVSTFGGVIQRFPSKPVRPRIRSYGDPTRRGSMLTPDVFVTDTRLIRRGVDVTMEGKW